MRKILGLLILSCLILPQGARAQGALVVTTCGTLPKTYAPGATRQVTVDINGNICQGAVTVTVTTPTPAIATPLAVTITGTPVSLTATGSPASVVVLNPG